MREFACTLKPNGFFPHGQLPIPPIAQIGAPLRAPPWSASLAGAALGFKHVAGHLSGDSSRSSDRFGHFLGTPDEDKALVD